MYSNTSAQFRPELLSVVQEAQGADRSYIAETLFPIYPVKTRNGDYMKITKGGGGLLATAGSDALMRAPGTAYPSTGRTFTKDNWLCVDRGLTEPMDDVITHDIARFFDSEAAAAIFLQRNIRIAREQRVAALIQDTGTWGTADTSVKIYSEANIATIDFARDMKGLIRKLRKRGEQATDIVIASELWDLISVTDKLKEFCFGTLEGKALVTPEEVASKLRIRNILLGEASYSTAREGATVSDSDLAWCWSSDKIWCGSLSGGAPEAGGAGRTFMLEETTDGQLTVVETYRDEPKRSNVLRVREDTQEKVINAQAGVLLDTTAE